MLSSNTLLLFFHIDGRDFFLLFGAFSVDLDHVMHVAVGKAGTRLCNASDYNPAVVDMAAIRATYGGDVISGWLDKSSGTGKSRTWQRRWVALRGSSLHFYTSPDKEKPSLEVSLIGSVVGKDNSGDNKGILFRWDKGEPDMELKMGSERDRELWLEAVRAALRVSRLVQGKRPASRVQGGAGGDFNSDSDIKAKSALLAMIVPRRTLPPLQYPINLTGIYLAERPDGKTYREAVSRSSPGANVAGKKPGAAFVFGSLNELEQWYFGITAALIIRRRLNLEQQVVLFRASLSRPSGGGGGGLLSGIFTTSRAPPPTSAPSSSSSSSSSAPKGGGLLSFLGFGPRSESYSSGNPSLSTSPADSVAHVALGLTQERQGFMEAAIESFSLAARTQPGLAAARLHLGRVLLLANSDEAGARSAMPHLQASVSALTVAGGFSGPTTPLALYRLGRAPSVVSSAAPTSMCYEAALMAHVGGATGRWGARWALGGLLLDGGKYEAALGQLRNAVGGRNVGEPLPISERKIGVQGAAAPHKFTRGLML